MTTRAAQVAILSLLAVWGCGAGSDGDGDDGSGTSGSSTAVVTSEPSTDGSTTNSNATTDGALDSSIGTTSGPTSTDDGSSSGDTDEPPASPRVLFLGNSYTQFNAMTDMVTSLADDIGQPLTVMAITQGGATVADLLARPDVQEQLASPGWDFVVIQGQSYEPLAQPAVFEDAALELAGLVQDAAAEPVMFETWARVEGHPLYDEPFSGGDPATMQALLHAAYAGVAEQSGGTLAPVGQGWAQCLADAPGIVLHSPDGSHPSVAGSYLTAAVFVGVLLQISVVGNGWMPDGMTPEDAGALLACAELAAAG